MREVIGSSLMHQVKAAVLFLDKGFKLRKNLIRFGNHGHILPSLGPGGQRLTGPDELGVSDALLMEKTLQLSRCERPQSLRVRARGDDSMALMKSQRPDGAGIGPPKHEPEAVSVQIYLRRFCHIANFRYG